MFGGKRKKITIISIVSIMVVAMIAGAVWLYSSVSIASQTTAEPSVASTTAPLEMSAYYIVLPEPFIFNVMGKEHDRLVQIKVQLMVRGEANETLANKHIPLIESRLLQTFSATTVEQLRQPLGREQLRQQALTAVQATMNKMTDMPVIERVLFTGFVMQ